ncbi:MAG: hypothetical protein A2534_02075 [Candidatus Magasanikbacteria bacterium RIFOXYD2_FULL_39_9]|uniref:Transcription regulator TrmB N-terminal domain-containing protein n=1 Tax=Candidatus Magasanikbacteria bacterium RIFOXYD1_FULL_40_23 TaxID=1798705 RepID=A0A1F6PAR0_9BACT|nr:MAG: hypothetical protein A2534_02075 [Candidatus Magasanikbacteria bacterium RIFOXYD2_FULL_39_9]OGH93024.1 MAG: hypothetical protein A2563_05440 [Candidatus Magasanikbacteria bacterium RIFOXYD1_FULL_40_23]
MKLTNIQQKEIDENLSLFGLHDKDKKVYLTLLSTGPNTITPLGRALGLPPTTVQAVLQRLENKGVVAISKKKSRHTYEALDPIVFKKILERNAHEFSAIIPWLQSLKQESESTAKIRIYYRERMTDIFYEALNTKSKIIYEIVSGREFQDIIGEKLHFTLQRTRAGIHLKSLRVEANEIKKYSAQTHARELREAKFLPREITFHGNIMFWDNTVAFFTTKEEGLAWIVESKNIKEMISQIFDLLWSVSRKMETVV